MTEMWQISPDPRTQNQVAGILLIREMRRIANGELTEPERCMTAIATEARRAETVKHGSVHEGAGRKASSTLPTHPQTTD